MEFWTPARPEYLTGGPRDPRNTTRSEMDWRGHDGGYRDDPDGIELTDDGAAREAALQVIRDLEKNSEIRWND
jgi:hypothetical protein